MNTYIAYNKSTFQILGFISNDYTTIEETAEVFQNFENYDVKKTELEIPSDFSSYKVIITDNEITGFEKIEREEETN